MSRKEKMIDKKKLAEENNKKLAERKRINTVKSWTYEDILNFFNNERNINDGFIISYINPEIEKEHPEIILNFISRNNIAYVVSRLSEERQRANIDTIKTVISKTDPSSIIYIKKNILIEEPEFCKKMSLKGYHIMKNDNVFNSISRISKNEEIYSPRDYKKDKERLIEKLKLDDEKDTEDKNNSDYINNTGKRLSILDFKELYEKGKSDMFRAGLKLGDVIKNRGEVNDSLMDQKEKKKDIDENDKDIKEM